MAFAMYPGLTQGAIAALLAHASDEIKQKYLPKMVEALGKRDLELMVMATSIHNPSQEYTERVLKTAGKLGIKYYRLGWWDYDYSKPIPLQLENIILNT